MNERISDIFPNLLTRLSELAADRKAGRWPAPFRRPIVVVGSKAYPVNGINITTDPKIPLEDFLWGRYDDTVKVAHTIKARGEVVEIPEAAKPRVEYRKSGRMVCYYES